MFTCHLGSGIFKFTMSPFFFQLISKCCADSSFLALFHHPLQLLGKDLSFILKYGLWVSLNFSPKLCNWELISFKFTDLKFKSSTIVTWICIDHLNCEIDTSVSFLFLYEMIAVMMQIFCSCVIYIYRLFSWAGCLVRAGGQCSLSYHFFISQTNKVFFKNWCIYSCQLYFIISSSSVSFLFPYLYEFHMMFVITVENTHLIPSFEFNAFLYFLLPCLSPNTLFLSEWLLRSLL